MRDLNHLDITGRMTKDPEFKKLPNGKTLAKFSIANKRGTDRNGHEYPAYFFDVEVWGKGAEIVRQYGHKSKELLIEGRIVRQKWKSESGENRQRVIIAADRFIFMGSKPARKDKDVRPADGLPAPGEGGRPKD